jgi:hypothetical protein
LRLLIEDVSEADAPARKIAEKILPEVTVLPGKHFTLTAEVPLDAIDPRRSYNVRVHLSMKGANTVQVGDLISTQSLPVLTHGRPSRVAVSLREVR